MSTAIICKTCKHFGIGKCCGCVNASHYEENVKTIDTERKYATWEMIKILTKNPGYKAKASSNITVSIDINGNMRYTTSNETHGMFYLDNSFLSISWTIIKPVEKVNFIEACKAYKDKKCIKSLVSNEVYHDYNFVNSYLLIRDLSNEEIEGDWEVKEDGYMD